MAKTVNELPLYTKVLEFWHAVSAILERSALRRNRRLYDRIDDANDSIESNISEGFQQPTDAAFANFVGISRPRSRKSSRGCTRAIENGW
jgi:four helix bundle protein